MEKSKSSLSKKLVYLFIYFHKEIASHQTIEKRVCMEKLE